MLNQVALLKHFCDTLWEYDPEKENAYIYHETLQPEICWKWIDYRTLYQERLERYVYAEDRDIWEQYMSPEALKDFLDSTLDETSFTIRMKHTEYDIQWHEAYLERYKGHVLVGSRDMKKEQKNAAIASAVLPEFDYVCRIDVRTGGYELYYMNRADVNMMKQRSEDYEQAVAEYLSGHVAAEEAKDLTGKMKIGHIVEELKKSEEYVLFAEVKPDGCSQNVYKRLRFCYADESHQILLLTSIDVSENFREKKRREEAEQKYRELLTNMPIAISSTEVLLDEEGKPYDFRYTYCNPAHEKLEGVEPGTLVGKEFYQFFENTDPGWLQIYYETAWLGIPHVARKYSPEIGKDLLIHTFRTEPGHCDCVLQDVTQENFLLRELHQSRTEMMRVLETTTEAVFQYDPKTDEIKQSEYTSGGKSRAYHTDKLLKIFAEKGRVEEESISILRDCFSRIRKGEHFLSVPLRCSRRGSDEWIWFKLSLFDYLDEITKERKVLGYIQDINKDMTRQKELLEKAQTDALTGILNVGAGRAHIQKLLNDENGLQKVMFMMDVDDFKVVNDSYGHAVGDKTLKCFAGILAKVFKDPAVVYRLGGDEFAVFIPELCNAEERVEELVKELDEDIQNAKEEFPFLSISVGIYITDLCQSYEQMYMAADKALYQTKKNKKGYYTVLNDSKKI